MKLINSEHIVSFILKRYNKKVREIISSKKISLEGKQTKVFEKRVSDFTKKKFGTNKFPFSFQICE